MANPRKGPERRERRVRNNYLRVVIASDCDSSSVSCYRCGKILFTKGNKVLIYYLSSEEILT